MVRVCGRGAAFPLVTGEGLQGIAHDDVRIRQQESVLKECKPSGFNGNTYLSKPALCFMVARELLRKEENPARSPVDAVNSSQPT